MQSASEGEASKSLWRTFPLWYSDESDTHLLLLGDMIANGHVAELRAHVLTHKCDFNVSQVYAPLHHACHTHRPMAINSVALAVRKGDHRMTKTLIELGADQHISSEDEKLALFDALSRHLIDIVHLLLPSFNLSRLNQRAIPCFVPNVYKPGSTHSPLSYAIMAGFVDAIGLFGEWATLRVRDPARASRFAIPLVAAMVRGDERTLDALVAAGDDPSVDVWPGPPGPQNVATRCLPFVKNESIFRRLFEHGAKFDACAYLGELATYAVLLPWQCTVFWEQYSKMPKEEQLAVEPAVASVLLTRMWRWSFGGHDGSTGHSATIAALTLAADRNLVDVRSYSADDDKKQLCWEPHEGRSESIDRVMRQISVVQHAAATRLAMAGTMQARSPLSDLFAHEWMYDRRVWTRVVSFVDNSARIEEDDSGEPETAEEQRAKRAKGGN